MFLRMYMQSLLVLSVGNDELKTLCYSTSIGHLSYVALSER